MEHSKGKMIAETKQSDLGNGNARCSIGIKHGKILFNTTKENQIANALHLVKCWNAFNKGGSYDKLLIAAKEGLSECHRIRHTCHCPTKDLDTLEKRIQRIDTAIAEIED